MFGAKEARVTVLLQEQDVHMLRGQVVGVARGILHQLLGLFHCFAVDVDLTRRSGLQELPAMGGNDERDGVFCEGQGGTERH